MWGTQKDCEVFKWKAFENEALEGQPRDMVKLHEEINSIKTSFAKFVGGTKALDQMLMYCRCPKDESGNGYEGNVYSHDEEHD